MKALLDVLAQFVAWMPFAKVQPEITVAWSKAGHGEAEAAGRFLLERAGDGAIRYVYHADPVLKGDELIRAAAELVVEHRFADLESLRSWLTGHRLVTDRSVAFVHGAAFEPHELTVMLDEDHPEVGLVEFFIVRHPAWERWFRGAGGGEAIDLTHHELADLLLDNREDLDEPAVASVVAQFRSAKTVTYDGDLGDNGHEGVLVQWKGSGGQAGATSEVALPREFTATLPAWSGPWAPGEEPRHLARFRLRVLPPAADAPTSSPTFRLLWVNALDYELEAKRALLTRCQASLDGLVGRVVAGRPLAHRFVTPRGWRSRSARR